MAERPPLSAYTRRLIAVTLPLYALDQASKWAVYHQLPPEGEGVTVIPGFFTLVHWYNTGAAFSLFSNNNAFFIALSTVALGVLAFLAWRNFFPDRVSRFGWALLLAGVLGNLTDRLIHGAVLDFILLRTYIPRFDPWPAFNVADACICIAAALFLWQSFREGRAPSSSPAPPASPPQNP